MTNSYVIRRIHDISHSWHIHGSFKCDIPACLDRCQLDWGGSGCRQDVPRIDRRGAQTRLAAGRTLFARIPCAPLCLSRVISCASTSRHVITSSYCLHKLCVPRCACHIWMGHVTCGWVTWRYHIIILFARILCATLRQHFTHAHMDSVTVEHYLHVPNCAFHIWMGKSRAGESRHVITSSYYLHELCVPRHIWMGDVTCGWVTSRYRVII